MKGLCDQSSLNWGPLPPNEVGRIAQHVRKGEGRKQGKKGGVILEGKVLLSMESWTAAKKASS